MAQRRFHYEKAFEYYLRANKIPYVAVDEAKKSLVSNSNAPLSLKSFDFVVYAEKRNLLIDVKGRMFGSASGKRRTFESWVTIDDIEGLTHWQELFGPGFQAVFVFAYCLRQQPPDALFEEVFSFGSRWYALREVSLDAYRKVMKKRSSKWKTMYVPARDFRLICRPFVARREMTKEDTCEAPVVGIS